MQQCNALLSYLVHLPAHTQHLLDSNILAYREDVEELTGAAVKEEMIEVKLAQLKADWANYNLAFAEYKTRGPVILKPSDTSELMEKLEESQMTLGSMSTNRWVCWCTVLYGTATSVPFSCDCKPPGRDPHTSRAHA